MCSRIQGEVDTVMRKGFAFSEEQQEMSLERQAGVRSGKEGCMLSWGSSTLFPGLGCEETLA